MLKHEYERTFLIDAMEGLLQVAETRHSRTLALELHSSHNDRVVAATYHTVVVEQQFPAHPALHILHLLTVMTPLCFGCLYIIGIVVVAKHGEHAIFRFEGSEGLLVLIEF